MQQISDREKAVVRAFLNQHAAGNTLPFPLKALSDVLLASFGWPVTQGKIRAAAIIEEFRQTSTIQCTYAKNGTLRGVMVTEKTIDVATTPQPESAVAHDPVPVVPNVVPPKTPPREKGAIRRERRAHEIGDRNETRFYRLVRSFLDLLQESFPENVLEAQASKSGVHNPRAGKVDLRDHHGDDVRISLRVRWSETFFEGALIYDAKSSDFHANLFNGEVRRYPEQKDALLKRAIVVGQHVPDADILAELVNDMVAVNLVPAPVTETIFEKLSFFHG